jgi:hypothetical protein
MVCVHTVAVAAVQTDDQLKFASLRERQMIRLTSTYRAEVHEVTVAGAGGGFFYVIGLASTYKSAPIAFNATDSVFRSQLLAVTSLQSCGSVSVTRRATAAGTAPGTCCFVSLFTAVLLKVLALGMGDVVVVVWLCG